MPKPTTTKLIFFFNDVFSSGPIWTRDLNLKLGFKIKYLIVEPGRHDNDQHSSNGGASKAKDLFNIGHIDNQQDDHGQNANLNGY